MEKETAEAKRAEEDGRLRREGMRAVLEALAELRCPHGCAASPPCEFMQRLDAVGAKLVGWRR